MPSSWTYPVNQRALARARQTPLGQKAASEVPKWGVTYSRAAQLTGVPAACIGALHGNESQFGTYHHSTLGPESGFGLDPRYVTDQWGNEQLRVYNLGEWARGTGTEHSVFQSAVLAAEHLKRQARYAGITISAAMPTPALAGAITAYTTGIKAAKRAYAQGKSWMFDVDDDDPRPLHPGGTSIGQHGETIPVTPARKGYLLRWDVLLPLVEELLSTAEAAPQPAPVAEAAPVSQPSAPEPSLTPLLAAHPELHTHQHLINYFYRHSNNTYAGAAALAQRYGVDLAMLVRTRGATIASREELLPRTTARPPTTPIAVPARAVFKMVLLDSPELLTGHLELLAADGTALFTAEATSGLPGWQGDDDRWERSHGPLPDLPGLAIATEAVEPEYASERSLRFRILPDTIVDPVSGITRGDVGVHEQGQMVGSYGGIAVLREADFRQFASLCQLAARQGVAFLPLSVVYETPSQDASGLAVRAVFSMPLRQTADLLIGQLTLYDASQTIVYRTAATSGQRGQQHPDRLWTVNKGPIPPLENISIDTRVYYSQTIGGEAFRIKPEVFLQPQDGARRSAFRVHYDNGNPGSSGCIVIRDQDEFDQFVDLMAAHVRKGRTEVPLTMLYS